MGFLPADIAEVGAALYAKNVIAPIGKLGSSPAPRTALIVFAPFQTVQVLVLGLIVATMRYATLPALLTDLLITTRTCSVSCLTGCPLPNEYTTGTAVQPRPQRHLEFLPPCLVRHSQLLPYIIRDMPSGSEVLKVEVILTPAVGVLAWLVNRFSKTVDHGALETFAADAVFFGISHANTVSAGEGFLFGTNATLEDGCAIGGHDCRVCDCARVV